MACRLRHCTAAHAIPRLLGSQAAKMQRHEPWVWHIGAAWLCWAQFSRC